METLIMLLALFSIAVCVSEWNAKLAAGHSSDSRNIGILMVLLAAFWLILLPTEVGY